MRFRCQSTSPATSQSNAASPTIASATTVVHDVRSPRMEPAGETVVSSDTPPCPCGATCGNAGNSAPDDDGLTGTIAGAPPCPGAAGAAAGGTIGGADGSAGAPAIGAEAADGDAPGRTAGSAPGLFAGGPPPGAPGSAPTVPAFCRVSRRFALWCLTLAGFAAEFTDGATLGFAGSAGAALEPAVGDCAPALDETPALLFAAGLSVPALLFVAGLWAPAPFTDGGRAAALATVDGSAAGR